MTAKPNILLLTTHDTGRHVSPYGIETVSTPNCERLASESVLFEDYFCTAPQCSPSRASIVTGRYPHANGTMGLTHENFKWALHETEKPIAKLLGPAGYATWLLGLQHETRDAHTLGFDHVDLGFTLLDAATPLRKAIENRDPAQPFYCQLGCFETHRPFDGHGTEPDDSLGVHIPPYLHDGPETRDEFAKLQGLIRRFDTGLGKVLDTLEETGVLEDTIVVVTTDHGLAMPLAKGTLFDPGIETMLFMRYPRKWGKGVRQSELLSNVDLLPTLLEAAGVDVPASIQGRSFLPLLEGGEYEENEAVFAEKTYHECYDPMRCARTKRFKYVRFFEYSTRFSTPSDIMTQGADRELGIQYLRRHLEGLYDLEADPVERNNLADDPAFADIKRDLRKRMAKWMQETGDPILEGPIPSPCYFQSIEELLAD